MGTQIFNGESETDAESIIKYTRKPKKPPPFVPRSRSLDDLPGGLRVPIIKKQDSRLQQKHEANKAGLEELKMLRQKHEQMVDEVRTTLAMPETGQRCASSSRLSSPSLASIKEEIVHNCSDENTNISRARFSISSDESQVANSVNSKLSSGNTSISSSIESLSRSVTVFTDQSEADTRTREHILADFSRNLEHTFLPLNVQPRRRASVQVECFRNKGPPVVDRSIQPKLRRASFQCEAVLTKTSEREPVSKMISDFKLQYNFPSPLHAVTRQYGSSTDIKMKENIKPSPSAEKDLKDILKEWKSEKTLKPRPTKLFQDNSKYSEDPGAQKTDNNKMPDISHTRNVSITSDYFGSTETLNTVKTFPLVSTNKELTGRRQSLPESFIRSNNHIESVPKLPERRRSFLDNSKTQSPNRENAFKIDNLNSPESDDGIFHEEEDVSKQKLTNKLNYKLIHRFNEKQTDESNVEKGHFKNPPLNKKHIKNSNPLVEKSTSIKTRVHLETSL